MGVDWGRSYDFTVLAVINANTQEMVAIDRFNQIGYTLQQERLRTLAEKWNVSAIWAEANSIGQVNIEELLRDGLPVHPFMTTVRSKAPLIDSLAAAIERREIALLPDDMLLADMLLLSWRHTRSSGCRGAGFGTQLPPVHMMIR
jgi:hypothetical protein